MTTRIALAQALVAAAEEDHKQHVRELYALEQRSGAFVSQATPTDPAGLELHRQALQQLHDEAAERQAARFAAQQRRQAAREELSAAERELDQAQRAVADLNTVAASASRFQARAQADVDLWRQRRDEALAQLPAAEALLATLEPVAA